MESEKNANIPPIKLAKDKFSGHVVVITGAAQGIGFATAQLFAAQGATTVLLDIQEGKLKAAAATIQSSGATTSYRICNVTDQDEVNSTLQWVVRSYAKIDVLAHIAGIYPAHPLVDFPTDLYRQIMSVNADATFFLVRAVLPHMQSKGYGRIILTSSSSVREPEQGLGVYAASKAAVIGLMRAASVEAGPGITVNSVMPGLVKTQTVWDAGVQPDGSHPLFDHLMKKQVVQRAGLPGDVAHAVCFLASPEAAFTTGQILDVSGGETFH